MRTEYHDYWGFLPPAEILQAIVACFWGYRARTLGWWRMVLYGILGAVLSFGGSLFFAIVVSRHVRFPDVLMQGLNAACILVLPILVALGVIRPK